MRIASRNGMHEKTIEILSILTTVDLPFFSHVMYEICQLFYAQMNPANLKSGMEYSQIQSIRDKEIFIK